MKIGFTGTKQGMTIEQKQAFWDMVMVNDISEFHHGDCVGADADAHDLMKPDHNIVVHPPANPSKRAFCKGYKEIREEKEYLDRNHDIVDETDVLVACPCGKTEVLRSGTWATIRYAKKIGKLVFVIYPDGSVDLFNNMKNGELNVKTFY
jgi:hypothetical protein